MIRRIKTFLKDLADFGIEEQTEPERLSPDTTDVVQEILQKEEEKSDEVDEPIVEPEKPQLLKCDICGKSISWKEEVVEQKAEIEGIVAEMQLMG